LQVHDDDPHLPACLVLVQYLTQCEGPLWRRIRGTGIAYGANIDAVTEQALISLSIYRSTDVVKAYKEMINTVVSRCRVIMKQIFSKL
jgi:Zn-dependent M16 (insulinase) family peptidase